MLARKQQNKKKPTSNINTNIPLDSSLTSIEWLPKMQIGENPIAPSTTQASPPVDNLSTNKIASSAITTAPQGLSLPITKNVQHKLEPTEIELPTTNVHSKPPFSYVTLIRQAIMSASMQKMTLNEIYQWIVDSYPYFRTAPPKWKNSIRHNLSLNKCFKRLQRGTNDPGKGSYWAVDETNESHNQMNSRKRKMDDVQPTLHILPSSPMNTNQHSTIFHTNNNPMICGDVASIGGQSASTDESDSTVSLVTNSSVIHWDDGNIDLTASFRKFREQVLDGQPATVINSLDIPSTSTTITNSWGHDIFPYGDTNSFFESVKLASSGEINWNDIDVKPYCEFLDGFRATPVFPQQDRDKLINLASSLSSFFDYTGITNLAQHKIAHESINPTRLTMASNRTVSDSTDNMSSLPVVIEDEPFDWDSIT